MPTLVLALVLAALAAWGILATIVTVARDGYRRVPRDPHFPYNSRSNSRWT